METGGVPQKRLYQVWKGRNKFLCGGRLIFGPDMRSMVLTVFLILVPVIFFAVFVSQSLVVEFQHNLGNIIVAIAIALATYVITLLFLTSGRDPGIIPRNTRPLDPDDECMASPSLSSEWGTASQGGGAAALPPFKDVIVNGVIVKVKYCNTCMLYRPPRCSHCSICNNCVERFDHHCPWVGQCIGKRNYRFFFMFVSSTTSLCLYVFAFCWVNLKKIMDSCGCNLWKAVARSPVSGLLIIYTFIAAWFVGGLTAFHLYLICTNQIPRSKNNFRAKVKEETGAFTSSRSLGYVLSPTKSFDLEMGGKRHSMASQDFSDIQSQIEGFGGLERSGTQPLHSSWGSHKSNWEIAHDIEALAAEFAIEHGFHDREKIPENLLKDF
ncbi:putative protein S-acyltransferase 7 [Ananas comosus]|uniref:S-acyltransferase n=1 Tax=Ananas comosus TaxID=4615 RepID=A0A199W658_ANACO|nr:putative protein S-acyltransferase 7 [Ananas comosus]